MNLFIKRWQYTLVATLLAYGAPTLTLTSICWAVAVFAAVVALLVKP